MEPAALFADNGSTNSEGLNASLADPEERRVIFAALDSFYQYRKNAHYNTTHRRRQNFYALPQTQWKRLAEHPLSQLDTFNVVDDCIDNNADLADAILDVGLASFCLPPNPAKDSSLCWQGHATPNDMSKAHSTLRQFYRDWSAEGFEAEVRPLLDVILSDLRTYLHRSFPSSTSNNERCPSTQDSPDGSALPHLLLPGAGLARLLFTLTLAGYNVEGNEISYHALLASNYILNHTSSKHQHTIHPWCSTFTNTLSLAHQTRSYSVPDIHPSTTLAQAISAGRRVGEMAMTAGDFITSYSGPESEGRFDGVVTAYFIDTAPNFVRYVETIHRVLRQEGVWVNIGPLLWHFDDRVLGLRQHDDDEAPRVPMGKWDDDHEYDAGNHTHTHTLTHDTHDHAASQNSGGQPAHLHERPDPPDMGIASPGSFTLTAEQVLLLVEQMGFKLEMHEILPESWGGGGYIQDPDSLLQSRYRCCHWVARKL